MSKDLFGFKDTRTEYERELANKLDILLKEYLSKHKLKIDLQMSYIENEELVNALQRCLNENIALESIYPELSYYNDDYDY